MFPRIKFDTTQNLSIAVSSQHWAPSAILGALKSLAGVFGFEVWGLHAATLIATAIR